MVLVRNQPAALRAIGPLTRFDLLLSPRRSLDYRETRRQQIAPILGEDLATRTIAMMIGYNSAYYSMWPAFAFAVWAQLAHSALVWAIAGIFIAIAVAFIGRRQVWMIRISRETRTTLSRIYGRPIKYRAPTPNVPAIRRALRRNGIPEAEWPPLPAKKPSASSS